MNLYHRFLSEVFAITTAGAVQFQSRFAYTAPAQARERTNFFGDTIKALEFQNDVAIVPIDGVLVKGAGFLDVGFGARAHETISDDIEAALEKQPKAIVLNVSSPGGTVNGTPELAAQVSAAAKRVPVYAFTDSLAASAAYWVISGATKIIAAPSAQVGSAGAILTTATFARGLQAMGIDVRIFKSSAATLKGSGNDLLAMSEDEAAYLQAGDMFLNSILSNRPGISEAALNGALFFADEAQKLGLIDGLASNLNEVIALAGGTGSQSTGIGSRASAGDEFVRAGEAAYQKAVASGRIRPTVQRLPSKRYSVADLGTLKD